MKMVPIRPVSVKLPNLEEKRTLIKEVGEGYGEGIQEVNEGQQGVPATTTRLRTPLSAAVWFAPEEAARAVNLLQWGGKIGGGIGCLLVTTYCLSAISFLPLDRLLKRVLLGTLLGGAWGALIGNWLTPSMPYKKEEGNLLSYLAALGESLGRKIGKEHVPGALLHFWIELGTYLPELCRQVDNWQLQAPRADLFIQAHLRHRDFTSDCWPTFFCSLSGHLCFYPIRVADKVYEHCVIAERSEFQGEEMTLDVELMGKITTAFAAMLQELERVKKEKLGQQFPSYGIVWDKCLRAGTVGFEYHMYFIPKEREEELVVPDGEARIGIVDGQQIAARIEDGGVEALTVAEIDFVLWSCRVYAHAMSDRNREIKRFLFKNILEYYSSSNWPPCLARRTGEERRKEFGRLDRWQNQSWFMQVGAQQSDVKPLQQLLQAHFGHGLDEEKIKRIKRNMYDLLQPVAADARNHIPDATSEVWLCRKDGHSIDELSYRIEGYYVDKKYSRKITDLEFLERYVEEREIANIAGRGETEMARDSVGRAVTWLEKMEAEYPLEFDFAERVWERMYRQQFAHARRDCRLEVFNACEFMRGHLTEEGEIVFRQELQGEKVFRQRLCCRLSRALAKDKQCRQQNPEAPLTHFVHNEIYERELAYRRQRVLSTRKKAITAGVSILFYRNLFAIAKRLVKPALQQFNSLVAWCMQVLLSRECC